MKYLEIQRKKQKIGEKGRKTGDKQGCKQGSGKLLYTIGLALERYECQQDKKDDTQESARIQLLEFQC